MKDKKKIYVVMNNDVHIAAFSTNRRAQNFCAKKKKELTKIVQDKFQMQAFYHVHEVDLID